MGSKQLSTGFYNIIAQGGRFVHAVPWVGGDVTSEVCVGPFKSAQCNKWFIQHIRGITYRITNHGVGDHPHPPNHEADFVHGKRSEFSWNIDFTGDDLYHVLLPEKDAAWTVGPEPHKRIVLRPNVGSELQRFRFNYLPEDGA